MPNRTAKPHWYALPLLALGATGCAAAWMLLALALGRQCAWLAPATAVDMVLLLKLGGWQGGTRRAIAALTATLAVIVAANYLIAAGQVGQNFGIRPLASALQIGAGYAWLLMQLANDRIDLLLYAAGTLLAVWLGLSGRRRAPSAR